MKSFSLLITLLFLNTPIALARPLAPLMPPRERASVISSSMPTAKKQLARSERQAFGLETGLVGIGNNSSGDIAKLQLVFGLRANYIFPISQRFFLKPSIGFFLRPESEGDVSITQNIVESGLGAQYALVLRGSLMWHLGISQHLDYLFSRISVYDSSAMTPGLFRYRVGPSTGLRLRLGDGWDFTSDLEAGVIPTDSMRTQVSFSSGLIFFLD